MQKGEGHKGQPLGLTHGVGEGGKQQQQAPGRLASPDSVGALWSMERHSGCILTAMKAKCRTLSRR